VDIHRDWEMRSSTLARSSTQPIRVRFSLGTFRAAGQHNAIPRDAEAVIHVESSAIGELMHETVAMERHPPGEFEHVDDAWRSTWK
jgi:hypothetical protein